MVVAVAVGFQVGVGELIALAVPVEGFIGEGLEGLLNAAMRAAIEDTTCGSSASITTGALDLGVAVRCGMDAEVAARCRATAAASEGKSLGVATEVDGT